MGNACLVVSILKHWLKIYCQRTKQVGWWLIEPNGGAQFICRQLAVGQRAIPFTGNFAETGSNDRAKKALLRPVLNLLKHYKIILLADREFGV